MPSKFVRPIRENNGGEMESNEPKRGREGKIVRACVCARIARGNVPPIKKDSIRRGC